MTGTYDHRHESLRRRAEEQLVSHQPLPGWQKDVVERLAVERSHGWYPLLNRFVPHTPENRPDLVLVGPPGVLVLMLREQPPSADARRVAFVWTAESLAGLAMPRGLLTEAVLRLVAVRPQHASVPAVDDGECEVLGDQQLDRFLRRRDLLLDPVERITVAEHLLNRLPDLVPVAWESQPVPEQRGSESGLPDLFAEDAALGPLAGRTTPDWRTFLDDSQLGLVRRHFGGPARLAGPAGTGKSVLALHRLAYLARRVSGRLLYTSALRGEPRAVRHRFGGLAPQLSGRVEFSGLHGWAEAFLRARGRAAETDRDRVDAAFDAVWRRQGDCGALTGIRATPGYWKDEIDHVIKGRGLGSLNAYRAVLRKGRGTQLPIAARDQVWALYCDYERELSERGVYDENDVLMRALDEIAHRPLDEQYAAVVLDDVQEVTLVGLRLVHAISGNGPNQLLLVGDGHQQVRPNGWRLSECGLDLRGRVDVLHRNYRNRAEVAELACELDAVNRFDGLSSDPGLRKRSGLAVHGGGQVVHWHGIDQERALVLALRERGDTADTAVLTRGESARQHWIRVLREAGFPLVELADWDGRPSNGLCVGTVAESHGTEFRAVFLPDNPGSSPSLREEREASHRERLLAATRARDHVWIGSATP